MTDEQRIEESHGLWELAIARVSAISGCICVAQGLKPDKCVFRQLQDAVTEEREAFKNWQRVSRECGA